MAPLTTLGLGGPARYFLAAGGDEDGGGLVAGLAWARAAELPVTVIGGGSNIVVADAGVPGLVVRMTERGLTIDPASGQVTARAGEPWDELVARTVATGLAGLECLSGIPGSTGATPVQNVGAYGQEVAETIERVRVLDRERLEERWLDPAECRFAYRDSRFRRHPDDFAVLEVVFRLTPGGQPALRYPELARAVSAQSDRQPDLATVRRTVLELRRGKSMVLDPDDPNRRSAGSFFVNPVLPVDEARAVVERVVESGAAATAAEVPCFADGEGRAKLSAAWLIDHAGLAKGTRRGPVGISSRHCLALVHHGGGTTEDLLALAREVRTRVAERFGVTLRPEPIFLGFDTPPLD